MNRTYVVKKGDALTRIAARERVDRYELASLNGIHNHNLIKVGQVLVLPSHSVDLTAADLTPLALPELDGLAVVACQFLDPNNEPIDGMDVKVSIGRDELRHVTDNEGFIPTIALDSSDTISVAVKKADGEWKSVSEVKPTAPAIHARILSPKLKKSSKMSVHEGPKQTAKTEKSVLPPIGSVTNRRSENGHPVQQVALECPNPDNLRLGVNYKYRDIILAAARRSKLSPHAVTAIMNAEAAHIIIEKQKAVVDKNSGKQALGKDGKPKFKTLKVDTGEWDPRSANIRSSARGMTQFLDGTWISLALAEGTYLHERAKTEGWITESAKPVQDKNRGSVKSFPAFKLADGSLITATPKLGLDRILCAHRFIPAYATSTDANIQKLLDLRYIPEYAIHAAVDYGLQNLERLKAKGLKIDNIPDGEKAKLVYLTHHLGADDAICFIRNSMEAKRAKYLLIQQVGNNNAEERSKQEGEDYLKAHRNWLSGFIDEKINIFQHMCTEQGPEIRPLLDITRAIL